MTEPPAHLKFAGASPKCQLRAFEAIIRNDGKLMQLLELLAQAQLPQWRLVAGCLYQTVWNALTGRTPGHGINDYDVSYFDGRDLSWEAEDIVIRQAGEALGPFAGG